MNRTVSHRTVLGAIKNEAKGIEMKGKQKFDPGMKKDFLILRKATKEDLGDLFNLFAGLDAPSLFPAPT